MARIADIYRYPVKGLSGQKLDRVALEFEGVIPFDRAFAIENGPSGFDPQSPQHIPKVAFLMLMRNERLAELETGFDEVTSILTIRRQGKLLIEGRLDTDAGRRSIEIFFETFAADDLRGPPKILFAPGFSFSDTRPPKKVLSLINLESVRAIGHKVGADINPLRFRGNLYAESIPAWEEFSWVGKRIVAGEVTFEATKRIDRCAAINVDPKTGVRDLNLVRSMMKNFNHIDCGIYLKVIQGGALSAGEEIAPVR